MNKVIERIKKQVKDCYFIEEDSNTYQGYKLTVITKDSIDNIKKECAEEYKLLEEYGKYILGVSNVNTLIHNWAKVKIWARNKGLSISKKTYHISSAHSILDTFNKKDAYHPKDSTMLLEFAMSLADKKSKVLSFGMDDMSLKFLLDESKKPSLTNLRTNMQSSAINNLYELMMKAFYELDTKYDKVQINSGYRTHSEQVNEMLKSGTNLNNYDTTKYFIEYLRLVEKGDKEKYETYYIENETNGEFSKRIGDKNTQLIVDVQTKGFFNVLVDFMKKDIYKPSKHPYGKAYDIKKNKATKYIWENHRYGKSEDSNYKAHYHISMPW